MIYKLSHIFFLSFLLFTSCSESSPKHTGNTDKDSTSVKSGKSYSNPEYNISLRRPDEWILLEEPHLEVGTFAINIFKRGIGAEQETPLGIHTKPQHSYIAFWPFGIGTELPPGRHFSFSKADELPEFQFTVNREKSEVLQLNDGSVWAYFIIPANPPENWEKYGFIYAQVRTTNNTATCFDATSGKKISMAQCDYLAGDRYIREGDINKEDAQIIKEMLESISLDKIEEKKSANNMIEVEKPLPNMDITPPLAVKGKAKGYWYFEGVFSITLEDAKGNMLADVPAKAQGKWMTENLVPFEAELTFKAPDDERGRLTFHKANPSGLSKNDKSYSIPVIFPPK